MNKIGFIKNNSQTVFCPVDGRLFTQSSEYTRIKYLIQEDQFACTVHACDYVINSGKQHNIDIGDLGLGSDQN